MSPGKVLGTILKIVKRGKVLGTILKIVKRGKVLWTILKIVKRGKKEKEDSLVLKMARMRQYETISKRAEKDTLHRSVTALTT